MTPLTQEDLDQGRCSTPGCAHTGHDHPLNIHGQCHPHAALEAAYVKASGALEIRCARCSAMIVTIQVARRTANQ